MKRSVKTHVHFEVVEGFLVALALVFFRPASRSSCSRGGRAAAVVCFSLFLGLFLFLGYFGAGHGFLEVVGFAQPHEFVVVDAAGPVSVEHFDDLPHLC